VNRDYRIYLKDIGSAMESIQAFIKNMQYEEFCKDDRTASAVIRKLEIIGEATKQIPSQFRQKYPHIPWKEMAGMRDRLIHFYFGVDYKLVWETVKKRMPVIHKVIINILETE